MVRMEAVTKGMKRIEKMRFLRTRKSAVRRIRSCATTDRLNHSAGLV